MRKKIFLFFIGAMFFLDGLILCSDFNSVKQSKTIFLPKVLKHFIVRLRESKGKQFYIATRKMRNKNIDKVEKGPSSIAFITDPLPYGKESYDVFIKELQSFIKKENYNFILAMVPAEKLLLRDF